MIELLTLVLISNIVGSAFLYKKMSELKNKSENIRELQSEMIEVMGHFTNYLTRADPPDEELKDLIYNGSMLESEIEYCGVPKSQGNTETIHLP